VAETVKPEVEAIRGDRSLLADTDYVLPLRKTLEAALRDAVTEAHGKCEAIFQRESDALTGSLDWQKLSQDQQLDISKANRIELIEPLAVADEEQLLETLSRRSLDGWDTLAAALPTRFAGARSDAAKALEPRMQVISLRSDTLRTEEDIGVWLERTEEELLRRLKDGPITIG
jgi:hypothetical protein